MNQIVEALQFGFMRHALMAGVLVSVACGIVGTSRRRGEDIEEDGTKAEKMAMVHGDLRGMGLRCTE